MKTNLNIPKGIAAILQDGFNNYLQMLDDNNLYMFIDDNGELTVASKHLEIIPCQMCRTPGTYTDYKDVDDPPTIRLYAPEHLYESDVLAVKGDKR